MKNFFEFLLEETKSKNEMGDITHLMIHNNHDGVGKIDEVLNHLKDNLIGKKTSTEFHHHYEGSPPISFGMHPENKKFFVSVRGGNPNFSHEDVDANHPLAPMLASNLKTALDHLHKIMPKTGGVFHGAIMHTKDDVSTKKGHHHVTPYDETYSVPSESAEGKKLKNSKIGLIIHSIEKNGQILPLDNKRRKNFKEHPDVNHIDPNIKSNSPNFPPNKQKEFFEHMENARKIYSSMKPESLDSLKGHENLLENHLENLYESGGEPSFETYSKHLSDLYKNRVENALDSKKESRNKKYSELAESLHDNKPHFDKAIKLHGAFQKAKKVLLDASALNESFKRSNQHKRILALSKDGQLHQLKNNSKSKLTEENYSTSGAIRGLGYVSGDPAGSISNYATLNASDADTIDQIMSRTKHEYHDKYHKDTPEPEKDNSYIKKIASIIKGKR